MESVLDRLFSLRMKPRKHYLFPPGWKVPPWVQHFERNSKAGPGWKPGFGRFVSLTYARRESDEVHVYPIGINVGAVFKVSNGTTCKGAPTVWHLEFMVGLPDRYAIWIES